MRTAQTSRRTWIVTGLLVAACAGAWYTAFCWNVFGYLRGREDAAQAAADGRPSLRCVGRTLDKFDPETGLFVSTLGCCPSGWEFGYRSGWNATMVAALDRGEVASLRHTTRTMEDLRRAFAADPGVELLEGRSIESADRPFSVVPLGDGVRISERDAGESRWAWTRMRPARALFADGASTLLLCSTSATTREFATVDLPSARFLQSWSEWTGPPRPSCPGAR